jgi:hypothetical protein
MNEDVLERRIRDELERHAPVWPRSMPPGTALRVRARQGMTAVAVVALAVSLVLFSVALGSTLSRFDSSPAARRTEAPPTVGVLPSPQGTAAINDVTEAPQGGSMTGEDTSAVPVHSWEPYTDQEEGQEAYLVTQKHVVAYGHVKGLEWSLAGYETRPYGWQGRDFDGGPCGDLFIGDMGDYGGMSFCLHTGETAPDAQFAMAGFGNGYVPQGFDPKIGPPISGYTGLVGDRVARVELRLADGATQELPLLEGPRGVDARYFDVFVDDGAQGSIVALAEDGSELGHGTLCLGPVPHSPDNIGCGNGLVGVASVVTSER